MQKKVYTPSTHLLFYIYCFWRHRGLDRIVVGLSSTFAISALWVWYPLVMRGIRNSFIDNSHVSFPVFFCVVKLFQITFFLFLYKSPSIFRELRVAQSLVLLGSVFLVFSFACCIVCPSSICGF